MIGYCAKPSMTDTEDPDDSRGSTTALTIIEPATGLPVPRLIAGAGERAAGPAETAAPHDFRQL